MWNERRWAPAGGGWIPAAAAILLLLVLSSPSTAIAADEEGCLFCHRYALAAGGAPAARSLKVADPQDGIHASLYCSDCHGDARTVPHPVRPGASTCTTPCHASATVPESHRLAAWGGLTEMHRPLSQPVPPCLLCHRGGDRRGDRTAAAGRCVACHPGQAASIRFGVHGHMAASGGGSCGSCHPAHAAAPAAGGAAVQGGDRPETKCDSAECHGKATPAMRRLAAHGGAAPPGRAVVAALLLAAFLAGAGLPLLFPPRPGGEVAHVRRWVTSIPRIPRYTLAQRIQHLLATLLFLALLASAASRALSPSAAAHLVHARAGEGAALLLLLHAGYLVLKAVRHDLPLSEVAFLPFREGKEGVGKFSRPERWDYLLLLILALLVAATGLLLRRPASAGLDPGGYGTLRLLHLFASSAATVHLLAGHARLRLLRGGEGSALSIVTGTVPLATAEARIGWIRALEAGGTLVPEPEAKESTEESREGAMVRDLLEEGNRLARGGDFAGARGKFEEALRLYPEYSQARFNLAVACMKAGDDAAAQEQFRAFLEADPFNPMAEKAREYLEACRGGKRP